MILTTHAGSLPIPDALVDALEAGPSAAYAASLRESVGDVVRHQAELKIDVVNDGELGKSSWTGYLNDRLGGFERETITAAQAPLAQGQDRTQFGDFYAEATRRGQLWYLPDGRLRTPAAPSRLVCRGPVTYTGQDVLQRDIANFKAALSGVNVKDAFLPVAAPASVEPGRVNEYYKTEEEYVHAIAQAMSVEYHAIVDAGFQVQVDDAWITALWDRMLPDTDVARYRRYLRAAHRCVECRAGGYTSRPRPVPHLLGQLARPARHRHPNA